jgi:hypothetical protein
VDDPRLEEFAKRLADEPPFTEQQHCGPIDRTDKPQIYNPWGGCRAGETRLLPLNDPAELERLARMRAEADARAGISRGCNGNCGTIRAQRNPACGLCLPPNAFDRFR